MVNNCKTELINITKHNSTKIFPELLLNNDIINHTQSTENIIGLTFTEQLNFNEHIYYFSFI